jgi:phosphatidylserine/phosphatidylglycerophosphate/cardiolipin synthase-like enzyme
MPELDLGALRLTHGMYLLNPARSTPFIGQPDGRSPYQHRFSYRHSATSIADAAIEIVRSARRKVFLASFRIGDGPLLDALYDAVHRLRGGVYVITSWDAKALKKGMAELGDAEELTEDDIKAQNKRFDDMTRRGVIVRGHPNCHAKFLLADDAIALVSSANLETSALRDRPRRAVTGESGAVLTDIDEVGRLARFFTRLWFEGCTGEARPGAGYALRNRQPEPSPCTVAEPQIGPSASVIWTHDTERSILKSIVDIADRAREELLIASYGLVGLSERPELILHALTDARRRGVAVSLLVRGRNLPRDLRDASALAALGVKLCPDSLTHVKGAIADGRYGALFSANLDIDHGLISGVEVGVRLDGTPALAEAHRFLRHAMQHADMRFAPEPAQADLDAAYPARWRKPWPLGARLSVTATEADWRGFLEATKDPPILYEGTDQGAVTLYTSQRQWSLKPAEDAWHLAANGTADARDPNDLMAAWSKPRVGAASQGEPAGDQRGFVSTILERR